MTRFSIMDNTVGFYPTNMGSIPVGEASNTHRWQRGPMQWIANPQNREFESHPVLQVTATTRSGFVAECSIEAYKSCGSRGLDPCPKRCG